jgi:hypothetical protein
VSLFGNDKMREEIEKIKKRNKRPDKSYKRRREGKQ